ncbi:hypothetical protein M2160_009090 [Streptomyces sp. SAI-117]|nr:hypothetical protein [Streptomyces sp. SAI-117]
MSAPGADRGKDRGLGEYFRVWSDPDLQVLRPQAFGDEQFLDPVRFGRSGTDAVERAAHHVLHAGPHACGLRRPSARPFLDDALQQAAGEGDARSLDHLQVDGGEQMRHVTAAGRCLHQFLQAPGVSAFGLADDRHRVVAFHEVADGGRDGRQVDDFLAADRRHTRSPHCGMVHACDERGAVGVLGKNGGGGEDRMRTRYCRFHDRCSPEHEGCDRLWRAQEGFPGPRRSAST